MLQIFYTDGGHSMGRGPGKVVKNLLTGLNQSGEDYVCNPLEIETDEPSVCLNGHPILYTDLIEDISVGPNICTLPTDLTHFYWPQNSA